MFVDGARKKRYCEVKQLDSYYFPVVISQTKTYKVAFFLFIDTNMDYFYYLCT